MGSFRELIFYQFLFLFVNYLYFYSSIGNLNNKKMLTTLILTDNGTVSVEYKTDLPAGATVGNFTVMDILGLNDAEKHLGLDFKQLPYSIQDFIDFAETNNLALLRVDNDGQEILANYSDESSSSLLDDQF